MGALAAVDGATLNVYESGAINATATVTILGVTDSTVKMGGAVVYAGTITGTIAGLMSTMIPTWISQTAPATFTISPGATKVKTMLGNVFIVGDESTTVVINGTMQSGNSVVATTTSVTVKIDVAGQTAVNVV